MNMGFINKKRVSAAMDMPVTKICQPGAVTHVAGINC